MQIAYRAKDLTEAHIIAGLLASRGIESHVGGHYLQGAMGEIGAAGFTNVHVEDEDYPAARKLVDEYEASRELVSDCDHSDDALDQYARWFLVALLLLGIGFLISR